MATQINLRCSEEQKTSWKRKASSEGLSVSEWLKSLADGALGGPKAVRVPARPKPPHKTAVAPAPRVGDTPKPKHNRPIASPSTTINPFARVKTVTHF